MSTETEQPFQRPKPCPECGTGIKVHNSGCQFGVVEDRFIQLATKLNMVLGLNNEERQWIRECGYPCKNERE